MKAPFIWFGGKRRVADQVWAAMGDVDSYVEPFAGSLAVLLARPSWHRKRAETVNDADYHLANFWRALAHDPEAVAAWADWPVNEADLFARHLWLVNEGRRRIAAIEADPDFYDAKVAGWWVWGINAWIGSGWCSGTGPWTLAVGDQDGVQLPHLGDAGRGINRQLPHLGDAGRGASPGGVSTASFPTSETLLAYMFDLAARLRAVRVCCGDWSRVCTDGALDYGANVGVFLDPPYLGDVRTADLYAVDDHTISTSVREWAVAHGDDPRMRIVLCGYIDEHEGHVPDTWRLVRYSASLAYGTTNGGGQNKANRHGEALWFSPHCFHGAERLFA
ncbi:MAG: DNA adenine methylase [Actinomycetota bacterium]|nr:DNA adenine methylase [Actinomycetota bacterium]